MLLPIPHDVRRTMGTHGEQLMGFSRLDTGYVMDHEALVKQSEVVTSRTAGTGTHDVTGVHYSLHDGTHHSWPVMRAWADALEQAIAEATAALDLKQLAREFGIRTTASVPSRGAWYRRRHRNSSPRSTPGRKPSGRRSARWGYRTLITRSAQATGHLPFRQRCGTLSHAHAQVSKAHAVDLRISWRTSSRQAPRDGQAVACDQGPERIHPGGSAEGWA